MEDEMRKANAILKKISKKLLPKYKGKIIAIDINSGDYALGSTELEAYKKAIKKHHKNKFIFKRLGFAHTHLVGAL